MCEMSTFSTRQPSQPTYTYVPLNPTERQIRVLHLLAGPKHATPRCALEIVSLKDEPHFDALSYAWGTSENRKHIEVDDISVYVTRNLYEALDQFQSELRPFQRHIL